VNMTLSAPRVSARPTAPLFGVDPLVELPLPDVLVGAPWFEGVVLLGWAGTVVPVKAAAAQDEMAASAAAELAGAVEDVTVVAFPAKSQDPAARFESS